MDADAKPPSITINLGRYLDVLAIANVEFG
jgi:hypothetical protein